MAGFGLKENSRQRTGRSGGFVGSYKHTVSTNPGLAAKQQAATPPAPGAKAPAQDYRRDTTPGDQPTTAPGDPKTPDTKPSPSPEAKKPQTQPFNRKQPPDPNNIRFNNKPVGQAPKPDEQPLADAAKRPGASGLREAATKMGSGKRLLFSKKSAGIGGVIITIIAIAGLLSMNFPQLRLNTIMKNVFKHAFMRVEYTYTVRQAAIVKYYLRERFIPGINRDGAIVNYDNSIFKQLYSKLRDSDLESRLDRAGYRIEYGAANGDPRYRILRITHTGDPAITEANFSEAYNTNFQRAAARARLSQIANEVLHDRNVFMRMITKARLTRLTGTHWHWLDPIKQTAGAAKNALKEAYVLVLNETTKFILTRSVTSRVLGAKLLELLTGERLDRPSAEQAMVAAGEELAGASDQLVAKRIEEVFVKQLSTKLASLGLDATNPVGWVIAAVTVGCGLDYIASHGYDLISQVAKEKANFELIQLYATMQSKQSQINSGETNGLAIEATMHTLQDQSGKDISISHNIQRANGNNVAYTPTDDCTNGIELCNTERPNSMLDNNSIVAALKLTDQISDTNLKYIPGLPGNIYSGAICTAFHAIFSTALGWVMKTAIEISPFYILAQQLGLVDMAQQQISKGMNWVMTPVINWLLPPIVKAPRGPKLGSQLVAGVWAAPARDNVGIITGRPPG
jgi:hypothetical protein